jgi:hypothetical protein
MPMYLATYDVEIIHEGSGQFMTVEEEYEFFAENEAEAQDLAKDYMNSDLFDVVMSNISIVPEGCNDVVEQEEEDEDV